MPTERNTLIARAENLGKKLLLVDTLSKAADGKARGKVKKFTIDFCTGSLGE